MKTCLTRSTLAVALALGAGWAPHAANSEMSEAEESRMKKQIELIWLAGECNLYALLGTNSLDRQAEGQRRTKSAVLAAKRVYGRMYDLRISAPVRSAEDSATQAQLRELGRDFYIGMMFGSALFGDEAGNTGRAAAEARLQGPLNSEERQLKADALYKGRNCAGTGEVN